MRATIGALLTAVNHPGPPTRPWSEGQVVNGMLGGPARPLWVSSPESMLDRLPSPLPDIGASTPVSKLGSSTRIQRSRFSMGDAGLLRCCVTSY